MREQIIRILVAVADGWQARADQIRTLTNRRIVDEWEAGFRAGCLHERAAASGENNNE